MDDMDRTLAAARRIGRVRELQREPAEIALPELRKLLSPAQADAVVRETLMSVRGFGSQAIELLPAVESLADHPDPGVQHLVRSTAKAIREPAEATGDARPMT